MTEKTVAVIGAGGHSRSLINLLELNKIEITGVYDDSYKPFKKELINSYCILGKVRDIPNKSTVVLAIGDNEKRRRAFLKFKKRIFQKDLIHPRAVIEKRVITYGFNQVFSGVYLNSNVVMGYNNILNTNSILEHEVNIGNHNHISVNVVLCGRVRIGDHCFIGAGAVIIDGIKICNNVTIGANAVVVQDIETAGVYVGNPVKKIK